MSGEISQKATRRQARVPCVLREEVLCVFLLGLTHRAVEEFANICAANAARTHQRLEYNCTPSGRATLGAIRVNSAVTRTLPSLGHAAKEAGAAGIGAHCR